MGTPFCQNDPYKWVRVSRLKQYILVQTKSEYPLGSILQCVPLQVDSEIKDHFTGCSTKICRSTLSHETYSRSSRTHMRCTGTCAQPPQDIIDVTAKLRIVHTVHNLFVIGENTKEIDKHALHEKQLID